MKKQLSSSLLSILYVAGTISLVKATPITDPADMEEYHYLNSGSLIGVYSGNDSNQLSLVESEIESYLGLIADTFTLEAPTLSLDLWGWNGEDPNDSSDGQLEFLGNSWSDGEVDGKIDGVADGYFSGTWNITPEASTISFYTVKAGNYFGLYHLASAESTGSWSAIDIADEHYSGGGVGFALSHYTGFNAGTSEVPEPTTMLLFGTGLAGLAGIIRRKRN